MAKVTHELVRRTEAEAREYLRVRYAYLTDKFPRTREDFTEETFVKVNLRAARTYYRPI